MDHQTEQFEKLKTLIKLKRYEVPPPGYFVRFSGQVIARIEVLAEKQPSWLKRFWLAFEARPSVAASCGIALGTLLVTGFVFTQRDPGERVPGEGTWAPALGVAGTHVDFSSVGKVSTSFGLPALTNSALAPVFTPTAFGQY